MTDDELYDRREQTQVKHYILRHYLERFAHIVLSHWSSISYVDGFAGPWNARSPDLKDTSFSIALEELRKARETYRQKGKHVQLRCCFLERDREAYTQLHRFAESVTDARVLDLNSSFEDSIPSILRFIRSDQQTFPFIFIDPTGWTGFAMKTISPLLKLEPGEVLINFMIGHIRRFLKEERSEQSFIDLFGSAQFKERVATLSGQDLDDEAVSEYMDGLKREGKYRFVLPAIVLHPEFNRTHFHLIYATRHPKGVEVFKETEKRAMLEMERVRAEAQKRRQEERTGQWALFSAEEAPESRYYTELRERYLRKSRLRVLTILRQRRRVSYEEAWALSLESPLVWESDLKDWLEEWRREGVLRIDGLQGRERVPKRERSHVLVWQEAFKGGREPARGGVQ